jgi:hypothetical protein
MIAPRDLVILERHSHETICPQFAFYCCTGAIALLAQQDLNVQCDAPAPCIARVLLYMLARSYGARIVVEFGTSFGVSTLHLAAALRDNGGGRLITSEFEPSKVA